MRSHLRMNGRWRVDARGEGPRRAAVARAHGRDARGGALERARAGARRRDPLRRLGPDVLAAGARRRRRSSRGCAGRVTSGSARRSRTSGSWRGSGTCGWPRRSGRSSVSPWIRVRDVSDEPLAAAVRGSASADAGLARERAARPECLPTGRAAVPALRHDRQLARPGRREPDGVLVPRLPGRRRAARRVDVGWRFAHPSSTWPCARSASARSSSSGERSRRATSCPFSFEEHVQRGGPALYEYRPLVRSFVEARAGALAQAGGRADRARRAAARACGRDLRPRARGAEADRRSRRSTARCSSRSCSRRRSRAAASTGTTSPSSARTPSSSARSSATRGVRGRRAARRDLGRHAGRARRRASGSVPPRRASSRATGPRRRGCCRPASARRSTATACSSSSAASAPRRSRPTRRPSSPTRSRALRLATARARLGRPRPLRAARLAAVRDPARAADRGHAAARRGDAARRVPGRGGEARAPARSRSPTPTPCSPRRSTAGSSRSSSTSRSAPSSCAGALAALLGETWASACRRPARRSSEERRSLHASLRDLGSGEPALPSAADAVRRVARRGAAKRRSRGGLAHAGRRAARPALLGAAGARRVARLGGCALAR